MSLCRVRECQNPTGLGAWAWPTWRASPFKGVPKGRGITPALCVGTDDVGLDSLVRSYQEERTNIKAAIDARHRTCPRWHDMAAGAT